MAKLEYSIPKATDEVWRKGILQNRRVRRLLPADIDASAATVEFTGSALPSLPINWRFAESLAALKGLEAALVNAILQRKYGKDPVRVRINTDHAQLFLMSAFLWTFDPAGENLSAGSVMTVEGRARMANYFPDWDIHEANRSAYRGAATNIYRTKDDKFFHVHGSMNPIPTLMALGLPDDRPGLGHNDAVREIGAAVHKLGSDHLQRIMTDEAKQAGTICYTIDEYKASEHGKANADVGLFDIHHRPNSSQGPCWWPDSSNTSMKRPLSGLKVVELTRAIAGPAIGRGLAELGASVMRITSRNLADMSATHPDLNHGKWNACLDLKAESDRAKLRQLISEADVFLQGYRPGSFDKYGFGEQHVLDICKDRPRGIIYARENCYGWQGPWRNRSGWQQISDANCGVSYEYGRAMGNDEPVTPILPNSDYSTGVCGSAAILAALLKRAEYGGSYTVDIALNYYSQWLVDEVGMYPSEVWQDVWNRNGKPVFRHDDHLPNTLPVLLGAVQTKHASTLLQPDFFMQYPVGNMGEKDIRIVAPILQFPGRELEPGFGVGTRTNGVDEARWPENLNVEIVT